MKIIKWLLVNGATVLGVLQAIVKMIKELVTGVVNVLSIFMPLETAEKLVETLRGLINKVDSILEWIKEKLL
jgi:phage-related protein